MNLTQNQPPFPNICKRNKIYFKTWNAITFSPTLSSASHPPKTPNPPQMLYVHHFVYKQCLSFSECLSFHLICVMINSIDPKCVKRPLKIFIDIC